MKPLRILNTRPEEQAEALDQVIYDAGAIPILLPALVIKANNNDWLTSILPLENAHHAIFTSSNAAKYCFKVLKEMNINWPASIQVTAIGKATAAQLRNDNICVHQIPDIADSEHLIALDTFQTIHDQTILLIKGDNGRTLINETLIARGADVKLVNVYRAEKPIIKEDDINSLWKNDAIDIIVFTSLQAMQNILSFFTGESLIWFRSKPCIVISERLKQEALLLGMQTVTVRQYDERKKGFTHDSEPRY